MSWPSASTRRVGVARFDANSRARMCTRCLDLSVGTREAYACRRSAGQPTPGRPALASTRCRGPSLLALCPLGCSFRQGRATMRLEGIHHVTAITGDAPGNVEFYAGVLGLRLVKKTVNQD